MREFSRAEMREAMWLPNARKFIRARFGKEYLDREVRLTPTTNLFLNEIRPKQLSIVQGETGSGKSLSAAYRLARNIAAGYEPGAYFKATDLSLLIGRGGYLTQKKEEELEILKTARWIVVDDLGVEVCSDHFVEVFFHLVDAWAGRGITGVFITNSSPRDVWPGRYGGRTWSRIRGWSKDQLLQTADPDFRVQPKLLEKYPIGGKIGN